MGEDQLPDDIHQLIELGDIHPYRPADAFGRERGVLATSDGFIPNIGGRHLRSCIQPGDPDVFSLDHRGDFIGILI